MRKKNMRMTAFGLSCAMVLGCGAGAAAEEEERPTITIACQQDEDGVHSSDNYAIGWLEEQTGVNFEFVALPSGDDASTKLSLMLASGDYPDVICYSLSKNDMIEYGEEGFFIALNDLIDEYGENLQNLYEIRPNYENNSAAPDGNIYGFPVINECYHCTAYPKLWYNSDWLESLGLEEPTTTEELKEVLIAVKNSDYNGNGEADEIPLTGSPDWDCQLEWWLMNSFIAVDKTSLSHVENGEVIFSCDKEEFKEGLEYMHELYELGLIDPSTFSQSSDQMQQVIRSDENLVFAYTADHFGMGIDYNNAELNAAITAMIPVESSTGARYQLQNDYIDQSSNFTWFITDKCENVEAAFMVGDFMLSQEASIVQMYGEEGTYWGYLEEETESIMAGVMAKYWTTAEFNEDNSADYNANVWWSGLYDQTAEFRAEMAPRPDDIYSTNGYEARLYDETDKVDDYFYPEYLPKNIYFEDEDDSEQFNIIQTSLKEYVQSSMAQFITGELDLEKDWDSYVDTLQKYDVDTYIALYQQAYDDYIGG